jgi:ISXO2-like transposase domain
MLRRPPYKKLEGFASHETVNHAANKYVRDDVHTNTIEGQIINFKRGIKGIYQHCSEKHLHRYLAEFDFRYNQRIALGVDDLQRTSAALRGTIGKHLTYKDSRPASINHGHLDTANEYTTRTYLEDRRLYGRDDAT